MKWDACQKTHPLENQCVENRMSFRTLRDKFAGYFYQLKNVIVTRYSISGSGQSNEKPIEQVSLHFEEIIAVYQTPDLQSDSYLGSGYQWKIEVGDS